MKCIIRRNGKELGEFKLEDVQTQVIYGAFREGDEFRYEGTEEWKPISALPPSPDQSVERPGDFPVFWLAALLLIPAILWYLVLLWR